MKKDKRTKIILLSILILFLSVSIASSVFAYGGNAGNAGSDDSVMSSSSQPTGITNLTQEEADEMLGTPPRFNPVHIPSTTFAIEILKLNLALWQATETVGGYSVFLSNLLVEGVPVYSPFTMVWEGPKNLTRELYALNHGDRDSVRRANDRSLFGYYVVNRASDTHAVRIMMDSPHADREASRRANPRSLYADFVNWVYGTNAVKIMLDIPRGDAVGDK